jgi:hypothetical protein
MERVALMGKKECINILVGKSQGKRPCWKPRYRWEENIKMILREIYCEGMDWTRSG